MSKIIIIIALRFVKKLNFGEWLVSEQMRADIVESAKLTLDLPDQIFKYFGYMINPIINIIFEKISWETSILMLVELFDISKKDIQIPLTRHQGKKEKEEEISWNYRGRAGYYLIHLLAKSYGWVDTYIRSLSVKDGLAYVQEILVDDQLEREFYYSLSEIAYPYNKNTKKSEFKAMPRPIWMKNEAPKFETIKIPKNLLPVGVVTDLSGIDEHLKRVANETQAT